MATSNSPSCSAVLLGPVTKSASGMRRRMILPRARGQLDLGFMRDQAGRAVGGGRSVDDIAADGGLRADLVVGEPHRAARHGRQRARERGIVEEALDRRGGAEPHAPLVDAQFVEFGDFRRRRSAPGCRHRRRGPRAPKATCRCSRRRCDSGRDAASIAAKASASEAGVRYSSQMSIQCSSSSLPTSGRVGRERQRCRTSAVQPHPVGYARPPLPLRGEGSRITPPPLSARRPFSPSPPP